MANGLLVNINDRTRWEAQQDLLKPNHDELANYCTAIKAAFLLAHRRCYDFDITKHPICEAD